MTPEEMDTQTGADRDPLEDRRDCHEAALSMTRRLIRQNHILREIAGERERQDSKWGIQHHPDGARQFFAPVADRYRAACDAAARAGRVTWRHILMEEVYEALSEEHPAKLRSELVQVSAVVVNWIEDIDSRRG